MTDVDEPAIMMQDETGRCEVAAAAIVAAVEAALAHGEERAARVLVTVLDDEALRAINRDHLGHDWTTDVCTFPYANDDGIEGDLFVSLDTAIREAAEHGRAVGDELLLYVVHGVLHLCGWDDQTPEDRRAMRAAESAVLRRLGIEPHDFE